MRLTFSEKKGIIRETKEGELMKYYLFEYEGEYLFVKAYSREVAEIIIDTLGPVGYVGEYSKSMAELSGYPFYN
jgi:hypothetical protein